MSLRPFLLSSPPPHPIGEIGTCVREVIRGLPYRPHCKQRLNGLGQHGRVVRGRVSQGQDIDPTLDFARHPVPKIVLLAIVPIKT